MILFILIYITCRLVIFDYNTFEKKNLVYFESPLRVLHIAKLFYHHSITTLIITILRKNIIEAINFFTI